MVILIMTHEDYGSLTLLMHKEDMEHHLSFIH